MIDFLTGKIRRKLATGIILDVSGVGYGLELSVPDLCEANSLTEISLWVHTRVREDLIKLYGFINWEDKETFEILLGVNGIGPRIAMAILSTLSPTELKRSILDKRPEILELVPGIGRRSAEKIIVEMSGRIDRLTSAPRSRLSGASYVQDAFFDGNERDVLVEDVIGALVNLGFKDKEVGKIVELSRKQMTEPDLPGLLKASLQALRKTSQI